MVEERFGEFCQIARLYLPNFAFLKSVTTQFQLKMRTRTCKG